MSRIRRAAAPMLGLGCGLALLLACFHGPLFEGGQFAYRDAGYFYYPLYLRVQQEWSAGRWPLWDPWQNGGMPLLGNPVAAVLYPGKLIYAVFPHAWATRLYVVAHTAWAFLGMLALSRAWGVSWVGSSLAALSYAFGAPVLTQYCNVIFLVGASWLPWGFRAIDRLLRQGRRWGLVELALVLAMQALGGDPEASYLTVLSAVAYAIILARGRATANEVSPAPPAAGGRVVGWGPWSSRLLGKGRSATAVATAVLLWFAIVAGLDYLAPRASWVRSSPSRAIVWSIFWGSVALGLIRGWWRDVRRAPIGRRLAGLATACLLAAALSAVQLLPTLELAGRSRRLSDQPLTNHFLFSVDPARVVEAVWPNVFGQGAPENRSWFPALPPLHAHQAWVPSLYMGALMVILAAGATGVEEERPWRAWLTFVALAGFLASLGRFGGPLWWLRWLPLAQGFLGPHDPSSFAGRADGYLGDGFGSPYGLMMALVPGFSWFRYPGKLLVVTSLAISGLSGLGWDLIARVGPRPSVRRGIWGLLITVAVLAFFLLIRGELAAILVERLRDAPDPGFGPVDVDGALEETMRGLVQGGVVLALGLGILGGSTRHPRSAGVAVVVLLAVDLGLANARLVWTAPQDCFDATPRAVRAIEAAEREDPSSGPFRVHRMSFWTPVAFSRGRSPGRFGDLVAWERDTLQSLNGLPYDLGYTFIPDLFEPPDLATYFEAERVRAEGPMARALGVPDGRTVHYAPRLGFDLWNARYFLVPADSRDWSTPARSFASLLPETELVDPDRATLAGQGPGSWRERQDWMLLRNKSAFPRAWLVHSALVARPDSEEGVQRGPTRDRLYQADPFVRRPDLPAHDFRAMAFIEADDPSSLERHLGGASVEPSESVAITRYEPQRVELSAVLKRPGLVILADAWYPGWRLEIDGRPAPILRANRLMRGAAVEAGSHRLVYTYEPTSFRVGLGLSIAGALAMATLAGWAVRDPGPRSGRRG